MTTVAIAMATAGCSRQSIETPPPVGISTNINGLQRSACHCGGLETKKAFTARRKAEAEAQQEARQADTDGDK